MSESIYISPSKQKEEKYKTLLPQIEGLVQGERDLIANMANISAALKTTFDFLWVGFYLVKGRELVLGPFQGPVACTRIKIGSGVCGTSIAERKILNVKNVDEFPGHIACSADSRSEIVLPGYQNDEPTFLLDIDSNQLANFNEIDEIYLLKIIGILENSSH